MKNVRGSASRGEQMQVLLHWITSSLRRFAVLLFLMLFDLLWTLVTSLKPKALETTSRSPYSHWVCVGTSFSNAGEGLLL